MGECGVQAVGAQDGGKLGIRAAELRAKIPCMRKGRGSRKVWGWGWGGEDV